MKRYFLCLIIALLFLSALQAQQNSTTAIESVVILIEGTILRGEVREIDKKTIQVTKGDVSYTLQKKNVYLTILTELFSDHVDAEKESLIIFKNKDWLKSEVLEITSKSIFLRNKGVISRFSTNKIFKVYPAGQEVDQPLSVLKNEEVYSYLDLPIFEKVDDQKNKIYNITNARFIYRNEERTWIGLEKTFIDVGLQHTTGYRISKYLGVGLKVGFTNFKLVQESACRSCVDIFTTPSLIHLGSVFKTNSASAGMAIRGEFLEKKVRPYYNIDFGFNKSLRSRPFKRRLASVVETLGLDLDEQSFGSGLGVQFQPSIGLQFQMKSMKFLIDFGYHYENVNFESGFLELDGTQTLSSFVEQEQIRGFVLKIGILL